MRQEIILLKYMNMKQFDTGWEYAVVSVGTHPHTSYICLTLL